MVNENMLIQIKQFIPPLKCLVENSKPSFDFYTWVRILSKACYATVYFTYLIHRFIITKAYGAVHIQENKFISFGDSS